MYAMWCEAMQRDAMVQYCVRLFKLIFLPLFISDFYVQTKETNLLVGSSRPSFSSTTSSFSKQMSHFSTMLPTDRVIAFG